MDPLNSIHRPHIKTPNPFFLQIINLRPEKPSDFLNGTQLIWDQSAALTDVLSLPLQHAASI